MDPLSLSASAAGFFGLAVQIRTMLKGYISGIRNAPSEAGLLLAEIASLCSVLENLITFLGNQDLQQCRFDKTSVLRAAIEAGKEQLEGLYIKLAEIRDAFSGGKEKFKDGVVVKDGIREGISNAVKEKVERVRWPLKKVDFQSTMGELQRFTQTFGFSLTVENCKLLAETSAEVLKKLDEKDKTINGVMDQLKAISISIPAEMLSQQTQILEIKTLVVNLGERTVKELQSISRGVDNVQERLQDSEIEKILSWISPLEPQKRHYDIRQKRLEGTGGWFLQQLEFQQWIDEYSPKQNSTDTGSILTCSGIPGAGKSVICSLVIDDLITRFPPEGDVCVAYLYCDYRDQLDQTPVNMIGALLKQAISTLNESYSLPEELVEALRKRQKKRGGEQLNLKESHDFLVKAVKQFEKFYICLDALDECNTKHCANLLESLANVTKESSQECEIRLFVTGRPHLGWEDYIRRHPSLGAPVHICLEANQDDIRKFIAHEIEVDDNEDCMNDTLKNEIVERIVKNSDRMFLLPALQIQTILDQPTISKRRKALLTMPTELGDAFGATINRMRNQRSERSIQALDVLKLVFRSRRRMTPNEIRHYLAVDISDQALDWDNLPSEKSLVEWCLGLVVIDEETSTARLVHKSLHEYLSKLFKEGKIFQDSDGIR
ncbi:hypothetical protein FPQ18DRAFT_92956 [Pyronema domesticum]|nr:hypothetical protein FPQ18DRAFT_92956 [Pyronema domesticum]